MTVACRSVLVSSARHLVFRSGGGSRSANRVRRIIYVRRSLRPLNFRIRKHVRSPTIFAFNIFFLKNLLYTDYTIRFYCFCLNFAARRMLSLVGDSVALLHYSRLRTLLFLNKSLKI